MFLDPDIKQIKLVPETVADRIELYNETYACTFNTPDAEKVFSRFKAAAQGAQSLGIGVNAGHDLDLNNLPNFLKFIKPIVDRSGGRAR